MTCAVSLSSLIRRFGVGVTVGSGVTLGVGVGDGVRVAVACGVLVMVGLATTAIRVEVASFPAWEVAAEFVLSSEIACEVEAALVPCKDSASVVAALRLASASIVALA